MNYETWSDDELIEELRVIDNSELKLSDREVEFIRGFFQLYEDDQPLDVLQRDAVVAMVVKYEGKY